MTYLSRLKRGFPPMTPPNACSRAQHWGSPSGQKETCTRYQSLSLALPLFFLLTAFSFSSSCSFSSFVFYFFITTSNSTRGKGMEAPRFRIWCYGLFLAGGRGSRGVDSKSACMLPGCWDAKQPGTRRFGAGTAMHLPGSVSGPGWIDVTGPGWFLSFIRVNSTAPVPLMVRFALEGFG